MRNLASLPLLVAFLLALQSCGSGHQPQPDVVPALTVDQLESPVSIVVRIDGMACPNGCARPIQQACAKLSGVAVSEVSFPEGLGRFTFDGARMSVEDILRCVEATNGGGHYKATLMESGEAEQEAEDVPADAEALLVPRHRIAIPS